MSIVNHRIWASCVVSAHLRENEVKDKVLASLREIWELSTGQEMGFVPFATQLLVPCVLGQVLIH